MATLYTRTWDLKESLSDAEVNEFWRFCVDELLPACQKIDGTRSIKLYSGAGALRADLTVAWEMDDASVYEKALHDPDLRALIGRFYAGIDMRTTDQRFQREITPELVHALSGHGDRRSSRGGVPVEDILERRLLDKLGGEVNRYQDKEFLKATMAVCALTALADEEVSLEERRDIDQLIRLEPSLATFNFAKASEILDSYIFELTDSCEAAKVVLYDKVRRIARDHKKSRTVMRISYMIITADHKVHDKALAEFKKLCGMLQLDPDEVWQNATIMRSF